MELGAYFRLMRRWLWLVVLAAVFVGSITYANLRTQPVTYQASVTLQIGDYLDLANANSGMIASSAGLARTYITLLKTSDILDTVAANVQIPFPGRALAGAFDGRVIEGTSFLVLTVTLTDPVLAAEVANELAQQLILNSPTQLMNDQQGQVQTLQGEIQEAQAQLANLRAEMRTIDDALASSDLDEVQRAVLVVRRAEIVTEINTTQSNLAAMSSTLATLSSRGASNYIQIIERARIPSAAAPRNPLNDTLTSAAIAGVAAMAFGFVIEYLNDTLRSPAEIATFLNVPLLGAIAPFGNKRNYKGKLIAWVKPRSLIAEAYRALRVNILFREDADSTPRRVYLVTSASPSEGKSVTAANLAVTFAITGMRVLLIDADMRNPSAHHMFQVPNRMGLSNVLGKDISALPQVTPTGDGSRTELDTPRGLLRHGVRNALHAVIQKTEVPSLDVIPAGPPPTNPAELLDTPQMHELITQVTEELRYDVVMFDTPPMLVVTDAAIVSKVADAKTLLVIESGRTRRGVAMRVVQQMAALGMPLLGVIMNRLRAQDRDVYEGYYYYYGYSSYGTQMSNAPMGAQMPQLDVRSTTAQPEPNNTKYPG
jgi:polysaccharide biosynthesis transport protein